MSKKIPHNFYVTPITEKPDFIYLGVKFTIAGKQYGVISEIPKISKNYIFYLRDLIKDKHIIVQMILKYNASSRLQKMYTVEKYVIGVSYAK